MASLEDVHGGTESRLRRLYLGVGLLLAGTPVAALGLLGAVPAALSTVGIAGPAALRAGVAAAGLLAPAALLAVLAFVPARAGVGATGAVGAGVAALAVAAFALAVPADRLGDPGAVPLLAIAPYAAGVLVAAVSLVAAATAAAVGDGSAVGRSETSPAARMRSRVGSWTRRAAGGEVAYRRSEAQRTTPTDGGDADDGLEFLLDDEEQ